MMERRCTESSTQAGNRVATDMVGHHGQPYRGKESYRFIPLPVGAVKPEGWLRGTIRAWADGITGHLHEHRPRGKWRIWNVWDNRSYKNEHPFRDSWAAFEEQAYWADGLFQDAYLLDDARLKDIAGDLVDRILAGQAADGYIGGWPERPYSNVGDLYTQSLLFLALMSYHSAIRDPRVVPSMQRALRHIYANCKPLPDEQGQLPVAWRGGSMGWASASHIIYPLLWLYSETGDQQLMDLAHLVYEAGQRCDGRYSSIQVERLLSAGDTTGGMHGVDVTEVLRIPALYYLYSGNVDDLNASVRGIEAVEKYHGLIHGAPVSDEQLTEPGAVVWTETCDQTTWSATKQTMFAITGDVEYADGVERILFNVCPGSRRRDGRAVQYYTAPNLVACTKTSCQKGTEPRQRHLFCPDGDPGTLCCVGLANRTYPNYVTGAMWLASPDGGLAAACYGPCVVTAKVGRNGDSVTIAETTSYPFEETIRLTVTAPRSVEFPLYLRIPGWCEKASITVNGESYGGQAPAGAMVRMDRCWVSGDTVDVALPMAIRLSPGQKGSVTVERGPLVYALRISPVWKKIRERFPGFPDWECRPGSAWNYALCLEPGEGDAGERASVSAPRSDESYFTVVRREMPEGSCPWEHPPIELRCKGKRVDGWQILDRDVTPGVPESPVTTDSPEETITLVPYGCTPIRITYFPVARS